MKAFSRACKAISLSLLCLVLAGCESRWGKTEIDPASLEAAVSDFTVDRRQVRTFYEARGWTIAWSDKTAEQMLAALHKAASHGLRTDMFLKEPLPEDAKQRDVALTTAAISYASALARGFVDPARTRKIYDVPRPDPDIAAGLAQALEQEQVEPWLTSLPPQTEEYRVLSKALAQELETMGAVRSSQPAEQDGVMPVAAADEAGRARQLAVALERLRWLDRNPPATRIDVNTAATLLDYWRNGQHADRRRVVVGEPGWETPQLATPIYRLVANPVWRVPDSILEDELAEKSPAYFEANGMEWRDDRLVQLPGPKNALGQVKLDMRNRHSIYLHDTPAKALFAADERHRSHGCIRVEGAVDFARRLATENGVLPEFEEGLAGGDEAFVNLKTEIPVRLLYHTAFVENGNVTLLPDIYGWDDDVARALGLAPGTPRASYEHRRGDIGP